MTNNIVFITGNMNKLYEVRHIMGDSFNVINIKIDLIEIQSISVKEVIRYKIQEAQKNINLDEIKKKFLEINVIINDHNDFYVICEDSGLFIKKLKKFPGALIKFYYESLGNEEIIKRDGGKKAKAICCIGLLKNNHIKIVSGYITGIISNSVKGDNGFGWDASFTPNLLNTKYEEYNGKSYAELPTDIKNKVSQRYIAFNKLRKKLNPKLNLN